MQRVAVVGGGGVDNNSTYSIHRRTGIKRMEQITFSEEEADKYYFQIHNQQHAWRRLKGQSNPLLYFILGEL